MNSRRRTVFFCLLAVLAVVALLMLKFQSPKTPPKTTAIPSPDSAPPAPSLALAPLDSVAARRLRMISDSTNRTEFKLTPQEVYSYLEANHSNALSLVTAFQSTHDLEFLKRAAERFPNDPLVQTKVLFHDLYPEDRAKWIDALKASSPDNSLGGLLAAHEFVKAGDFTHAISELQQVEGKSFNDFSHESMQGLEEAYLSAGRSVAEAKSLGVSEVELPHYAQLKWLGTQFVDKAKEFATQGNQDQQLAYLANNWEVASQLRLASEHGTLLGDLVGLALQNNALRAWPPGVDAPSGQPDKWTPASETLAANTAYRKDIRSAVQIFDKWFPNAPDTEVITYMDRTKTLGELNAIRWLRDRHPELLEQPQ